MRDTTRDDYEGRIIRVQLHIQRHLDDPLSLDDLARIARFSPYHFHRVFRAMVGESVKEYVRRLRLQRAASQLQHTESQVLSIALGAGYQTHESFTRAFRHRFGQSPSEYRSKSPKHARAGDVLIATLRNLEGEPTVDVTVEECEPMTVASVRHTGPYAECHNAWQTLCSNPKLSRTFGPNSRFLGICYDDPDVTDADKIRYDACVTISQAEDFGGGVVTQEIEGGRYAVHIYKGGFDGLHECYRQIYGQWLPGSGEEPRDAPCLEIYLTDPNSTPPEEQMTEIRIPLK